LRTLLDSLLELQRRPSPGFTHSLRLQLDGVVPEVGSAQLQLVLGDPFGRGVRQHVTKLPVARHLEPSEPIIQIGGELDRLDGARIAPNDIGLDLLPHVVVGDGSDRLTEAGKEWLEALKGRYEKLEPILGMTASSSSNPEHRSEFTMDEIKRIKAILRNVRVADHMYHRARVISVTTLMGRSPDIGKTQMTTITLRQADDIADRVLEGGVKLEAKPLTVAVLDPGGHLVVAKRQDGSGIARLQIAEGKARGALGMGMGSRAIAGLSADRPFFVAAAASLPGVELVPAAGGVLVRDETGAVIGAVGVSGDISDVDERCAVEAIEAAGLVADTG
jgi:uncharacterized protein GlcG (DUF336 family)